MDGEGPICGRDDCAFDGSVVECLPNFESKCYCNEGYARDCNGKCVPSKECYRIECEPGKARNGIDLNF